RRRHTRWPRDWSSDVCSSDLVQFNTTNADPSARQLCLRDSGAASGALDNTIFAFWADLRTDGSGGGVYTSVTGISPNRVFNIERSEERRVGKEGRSRGARRSE